MSKKINVSVEQINEFYVNAQNNLRTAAKLANCSVITFARQMEKHGIPRKERTWNAENFYTKRFVVGRKIIPIDDIKKNYVEGNCNMTIAAKKIGCSVPCLRYSMKQHGMEAKPKSWNTERTRKVDELNNKEWMIEQLKTKSYMDISREVGTTPGNVYYYAQKHGLLSVNLNKSEAIKSGLKKVYPDGQRGENASNWRGGKMKAGKGYIYQYAPEHPNANQDGYVMEHRLALEKKLGRLLTKEEVVHHIDGVKSNNDIENLELVANMGTHTRDHFERSHITEQVITEKEQLESRIKELEEQLKAK